MIYYHIEVICNIYNNLNSILLFLKYNQPILSILSKHYILQIQKILYDILQLFYHCIGDVLIHTNFICDTFREIHLTEVTR